MHAKMAASMWITELEKFMKGEDNSGVSSVSKGILDGDIQLLGVVEALGPYLTSTEVNSRCRGTRLLAELLQRIPATLLNQQEVEVIVAFFCDRLKDHHSITPHVVYGLQALSSYQNLSKECMVKMVRSTFSEVQTQSLAQGDRRCVFTMLANFLLNRLEDVKSMESDFVCGYIQTMDGEKDPRNLVLAFQSVTIIAQNFAIALYAEDLFEVTSCYFPIDFVPPPNDPYGIKKEELVEGLRSCMSSSPRFAEFCLPLILEKLSSDVTRAKIDSLLTLTACAKVYPADAFQEFLPALWSSIRREVFGAMSVAIETAALDALTALTLALSNAVSERGSRLSLDSFIGELFPDCKRYLLEPEHKLMYPSCRLLQAAAQASDPACCSVVNHVVPLLLELYQKNTQGSQRRSLLDALVGFMGVTKAYGHENTANPMLPYKDTLLPLLVSVLAESDSQLRCLAVTGLVAMLTLPGILQGEERQLIAQHLTQLILTDSDAKVRKESSMAAAFMSKRFPDVVKEKLLPDVMAVLTTENMETESKQTYQASHQDALSALAEVSGHLVVTKVTLPCLLQHLTTLSKSPCTIDVLEEANMATKAISIIVQSNIGELDSKEYMHNKVLAPLLLLAVCSGCGERDSVIHNTELLDGIAHIVRIITQVQEASSFSDEYLAGKVDVFLTGNTSSLGECSCGHTFLPLQISSPPQQTQLVSLLSAIVSSLPSEVCLPRQGELLDRLSEMACDSPHLYSSDSAAKCYSAIVNKQKAGAELEDLIGGIRERLEVIIDNNKLEDISIRIRALKLWLWLTKSLVLRGHKNASQFIKKVTESLEVSELATTAAHGFFIILNDFQDVMSKPQNAVIRMMYRQRFFIETLPTVVKGFNNTQQGQKQYYLSALSHLLRFIPRQVLLAELPPLMPLLVQSLLCEEEDLQLSTMTGLQDLIQDAPDVITSYLDSIVPQMVKLAKHKPRMKVRMAALKCLYALTSLPHLVLIPHQRSTLRELSQCLDDKKRLVRIEAVATRGEWFLLNADKK